MNATWDILRQFALNRNLSIQWVDLGDAYWMQVFDGAFQLECNLSKDDTSNVTDFETNFKAKGNAPLGAQSPFASKTLGTKKLYKRVHGMSADVVEGSNDILFTVPHPWVKITGLEVVGGENLDNVSLYILDTTTGTYSTVPNYTLNQFGFTVQISKDYYSHRSEFDADLYQNMQIKMVYVSKSAKSVGFNFILNEVK